MNKLKFPLQLVMMGLVITACSDSNESESQVDASVTQASETVIAQTTDLTGADMPQIPENHIAMVQVGNGGPEVFERRSIPVLEPGEGEILAKVVATAINPIERRFREGGGRPPVANGAGGGMGAGGAAMGPGGGMGAGDVAMGAGAMGPGGNATAVTLPGGDFSGIVVKLGTGVTNLKVGDAIFSKVAIDRGAREGLNGTYSQYVITRAEHTNLKPEDQTFAEASGLGTVGVTALRTIWHADVSAGQRVFINGIGGGIGSSAAQFALERGAYVLGTASGRHHEYLESIGVHEAINYREVQFDEVITEPVDVVIETVSTDTANQALNILKPGGKLVSIAGAADATLCAEKQVICDRIGGEFGWPNSEMLPEIARLAREGHYRLNVDATFPLEEVGAAQEQNFNVGTTGKVVVIVDDQLANTK